MNTRTKTTLAAGLATLVAAVGGVSLASAQDGATGATGPSTTQPQDGTAPQGRPDRAGHGGRGDCPKDDGAGADAGTSATQAPGPQTTPEV